MKPTLSLYIWRSIYWPAVNNGIMSRVSLDDNDITLVVLYTNTSKTILREKMLASKCYFLVMQN